MKLVKFLYNKKERWGILKEENIRVLREPPFQKIARTQKFIPLKKVKLLAPAEAGKVVLVGLNYKNHAKELKMKIPENPILFLKPPTTLIGHNTVIRYPRGVKQVDYEGELALVIKKKAKNVPEKNAQNYILGYTCLNDVTARDVQQSDIQWTRAKSYDTFCPLGPWIETSLEPAVTTIKTYVNGKIKQDSCTSNFIFPVRSLISFISQVMTLLPGDVISTGTPPGVGPMKTGDVVEVEIEEIGRLKNRVGGRE